MVVQKKKNWCFLNIIFHADIYTSVKKYDENGNQMYSDNFYIINKTYLSYIQKVGNNYTIDIDTIFFGLTEDSIVFIPQLTITLNSFEFSGYEHYPDHTQLAYFSVQETNFFVSEHYPSIFNDIDDIENRFRIIGRVLFNIFYT